MKILFLGEITGKSGVFAVRKGLSALLSRYSPDFVMANVDSATGGQGIGQRHAVYLRKLGLHALTGGDRIFSKKDVLSHMDKVHYMLRPANFSIEAPGKGLRTFHVAERSVTVVNLVGQGWHQRLFADNPFRTYMRIIEKAKEHSDEVIVDFHAASTAEKNTMLHLAKDTASAVICTGQKVQTSDARVIDDTVYITDAGRCGSSSSVSGCKPELEIRRLMTGLPTVSETSFDDMQLQGLCFELIDGKARTVEHFRHPVSASPDQGETQEAS